MILPVTALGLSNATTVYSRSGEATGSGRSSSASISRNADVQAPMASASDRIAAADVDLLLQELPPSEDGIGA